MAKSRGVWTGNEFWKQSKTFRGVREKSALEKWKAKNLEESKEIEERYERSRIKRMETAQSE